MFFCKMASKSDFDTFLAPFWVAFVIILEVSGRHFGDFLGIFFKVEFFIHFGAPQLLRHGPGEPQGRDYREG